jgi:hypothetical protein
MAIDADDFYAKMPKPEPALQGSSVAMTAVPRQAVQDRVQAAPVSAAKTSVSRDVEAPDEPDELTAEEIAEQRREQDRQAAERLYDLPMGDDNPRFDEPVMDTFAPEIPDDLRDNLDDGEQQEIGKALVAAGLGLTTAQSFMKMGIAASRNGPLSDLQIQQRNADGMKVLERRWGDQVPAKLELARSMINEASTKWPGLKQYLNATGLGSDPKIIQALVARAERMPGRKR